MELDDINTKLSRARFWEFKPQHHYYINNRREYSNQFSHLYFKRLEAIRPQLSSTALEKWKNSGISQVSRVLDVQPDKQCICVGTLYKDMALKPNFLHDYLREVENKGTATAAEDDDDDGSDGEQDGLIDSTAVPSTYMSETDQLILEDESGRMTLEGSISPHLVTGVVVAVKGFWRKAANFIVEDVCVCGLPPQNISIKSCLKPSEGNLYLALVSGLNVGTTNAKFNPLSLQLLIDFISGHIGNTSTASRIAHLIVAGNSIHPTEDIKSKDLIQLHTLGVETTTLVDPMKELDLYLAELSATCPIDVMPGDNDPTNCFLPQQPLHPCLLSHTSKQSTASFTTNPYLCIINGMTVMGTSGQVVDDIAKYATFDSPLDILESTLNWRNMAPTAPDTLSVYPYTDRDPFLIHELPHLYFAGNQNTFSTRMLRGRDNQICRLVCVPSFTEYPSLVLVDLNSEELETTCVQILTTDLS